MGGGGGGGGLGFSNQLVTRGLDSGYVRVSIIVTRCIKVAKNGIQQRRARLAEQTRSGAGGVMFMGSNPA